MKVFFPAQEVYERLKRVSLARVFQMLSVVDLVSPSKNINRNP
jgi:hypothetical protein